MALRIPVAHDREGLASFLHKIPLNTSWNCQMFRELLCFWFEVIRSVALWAFSLMGAPALSIMDPLALAACISTQLNLQVARPLNPQPLNLNLTIAGQQDADTWGQARIYGAIGWGGMHLVLGPLLLP